MDVTISYVKMLNHPIESNWNNHLYPSAHFDPSETLFWAGFWDTK